MADDGAELDAIAAVAGRMPALPGIIFSVCKPHRTLGLTGARAMSLLSLLQSFARARSTESFGDRR